MSFRAVIYARCSTEEESQQEALVKQVEEARECVRQNGWILVDSYVESRSGTTTKGRTEYTRLYDDLLKDRFDIIVIKSQDRLARNTKDWYLFVDRLVMEQKKLYIYIERKFYTADDALLTGIKAILAEDYSRELSKKINNAHHNRQKNNGTVILTNNTYGYRKLQDKSVVLDEKEAVVKKRMYELCASGYGCRTIANILKNDGVLNRRGKPFTEAAIHKIIRNPMNKGTVVMNKQHYDFESKKVFKVPVEEQYVYENKVPACVSEELWELANQEIDRRTERRNSNKGGHRGKNQGKALLSGKLYCGLCGSPYYRSTRRRYKDGEIIYEWRCKRYLETGRNEGDTSRPQIRRVKLDTVNGCDNVHLNEDMLFVFLEKVAEKNYASNKEQIIRDMVGLLKTVLKGRDLQSDIEKTFKEKEKLLKQLNLLVDKLLEGVLTNEIYQRKQKELEDKLEVIQEKICVLEKQQSEGSLLKNRIAQIEKLLREGDVVDKANAAGMLEEVKRIEIYPKYLEIHFNLSKFVGIEGFDVLEDAHDNFLRIEYGNMFNYKKKKKEEREVIIDFIRENPEITAKMIAEKLGLSLSGVNYRITALKKEGRIRFNGGGGKGKWELLK